MNQPPERTMTLGDYLAALIIVAGREAFHNEEVVLPATFYADLCAANRAWYELPLTWSVP